MKPILFSTPMVKALLENRKFQTRRVIKYDFEKVYKAACFHGKWIETFRVGPSVIPAKVVEWYCKEGVKPKYQVGEILWARETTYKDDFDDSFYYKADYTEREIKDLFRNQDIKATPSIFMPKTAARIFLKVTNVRVERLQDITEEQAIEEGCTGVKCNCQSYACTDCMNTGWLEPPSLEFMFLWESTIKKSEVDKYGWNANPWVFAYEFERCEKPNETEVTE